LGSLKFFGIMWGCRTNDYLQFSSWIFFITSYLTSFSYESSSQLG